MQSKTAVLFKTHFWDETVENSYWRCKSNASRSDVYIFYDNTNGKCDIPERLYSTEKIFLSPYSLIENLGLAWGNSQESLGGYWYNGDYHQNIFILFHPEYEFICSTESDVYIKSNIDDIFDDMKQRKIDCIYDYEKNLHEEWRFISNCEGYYPTDQVIYRGLFCISFFSRAAAMLILRRRLEMSQKKREYNLTTWPIGEAVMAQEMHIHNIRTENLIYYCDTLVKYECFPCYLEEEVCSIEGKTFSHPVTALNGKFRHSNLNGIVHSLLEGEDYLIERTKERIIKISDFELYSLIFHHPSIENREDVKKWLISSSRNIFSGDELFIISGNHEIDCKSISDEFDVEQIKVNRVFSTFPTYNAGDFIYFHNELSVNIDNITPESSLIISARDTIIKDKLEIFAEKSKNIIFNFKKIKSIGDLTFFTIAIPSSENRVVLRQSGNDGVWLNFIRIVPGVL